MLGPFHVANVERKEQSEGPNEIFAGLTVVNNNKLKSHGLGWDVGNLDNRLVILHFRIDSTVCQSCKAMGGYLDSSHSTLPQRLTASSPRYVFPTQP